MSRTIGLITAAIAVLAVSGCTDDGTEGPKPALKKVASGGSGLPVAETEKRESVKVRASRTGKTGAMPNDDVHRKMRSGGLPEGHPPTGHGMTGDAAQLDGNALPLKKNGLGSAAELADALKRIPDEAHKKLFEKGFRLTFSAARSKRDVAGAREAFDSLLKARPNQAEAYRGLAYVALSDGFDMAGCQAHYLKALELRPDYGEVHYALAFLYLGSDRARGARHLAKALELKIPDEQGLQKIYQAGN